MKPHPRIRKTIMWTGAAMLVLIAVLRIVTDRHPITWVSPHAERLSIYGGWLSIIWPGPNTAWDGDKVTITGPSIMLRTNPPHHWFDWAAYWGQDVVGTRVGLALLVPFWLIAYITGFAWYLEYASRRRIRVGLCPKCNYDRAGIGKDAVCPECGSPPT